MVNLLMLFPLKENVTPILESVFWVIAVISNAPRSTVVPEYFRMIFYIPMKNMVEV